MNSPKDYNTADLTNTIHQPHNLIGQGDLSSTPKAVSNKSETKTKNAYKEKQMTKLFFAVTIPFFICLVPFYTRALIFMFYDPPKTDIRTLLHFLMNLSRTLLITNCSTNFFLYMLVSENFRKNCKALFCFK